MIMLKLSLIEFFFRSLPESFLLILASYLFTKKDFDKKLYFLSSILLAISTYFIRLLPIHFGIHTIINIMIYISITILINKIPAIKSIPCSLFAAIILSICEWLNLFILCNILNTKFHILFSNLYIKTLYSIPSLVLFAFIIFYIPKFKTRKEDENNAFNSKAIK